MKRGDVVIISLPGDYGKPRPAILVQVDYLTKYVESVIVAPLTTDLLPVSIYRPTVGPTPSNGVLQPSQVMVDKVHAVSKTKISKIVGHAGPETMARLDQSLAFVLGLAK
jgi:mRNA interferase MazF